MTMYLAPFLAALSLACVGQAVFAQTPVEEPLPDSDSSFLRVGGAGREAVDCNPVEIVPNAAEMDFLHKLELHPRSEATQLLNFGNRGLGITEMEAKLRFDVPFLKDESPIKITPGAVARWFEGPVSPPGTPRPDLPPWVTDFYVDFTWRPRPAKWLFIDWKLTPGYYSDLVNTGSDGFLLRGHGAAIVALSEKFQFVVGVAYVNRFNYKVVPAGGIRWVPNENTEVRLIAPAPRISHRIIARGDTNVRVYVTGEYGGGLWAIRRANGQNDAVDYSDLRVLAGIEAELPGERRWYAEFGYAFDRRIDYVSDVPGNFRPSDSLIFRLGFAY